MSNISSLIDVFKMDELKEETRIKILNKLVDPINYEFGGNIVDDIVDELVGVLEQRIELYKKRFPTINRDEI